MSTPSTSGPAVVVTVSDRCSRGEAEDRSGPLLVRLLEEAGVAPVRAVVVPDGADSVRDALRAALDDGARLVLTTGGTGLAPRDLTPEGTRAVVEREVPGLAEAVRGRGVAAGVPSAVLSRGVAGLARTADGRQALVVNLPGSTGGARDGAAVVLPLWPHVLGQLDGGDH